VRVHPAALCETDQVGPGTRIWAFAHLLPGAVVGADCNICDHVFIEGGARLGDRVTVKKALGDEQAQVPSRSRFRNPVAATDTVLRGQPGARRVAGEGCIAGARWVAGNGRTGVDADGRQFPPQQVGASGVFEQRRGLGRDD